MTSVNGRRRIAVVGTEQQSWLVPADFPVGVTPPAQRLARQHVEARRPHIEGGHRHARTLTPRR